MTDTTIKRHPIRGALFGLMLGISAAYFLYFQFAVFGFDTLGGVITRFAIIILSGVIVGSNDAYVAPPKKPKGPAPAPAAPAPSPPDEKAVEEKAGEPNDEA